jgi:hypothetical protein
MKQRLLGTLRFIVMWVVKHNLVYVIDWVNVVRNFTSAIQV